MANLIQTQQVTKTNEGLLINSGFDTWTSGDYRMLIDYVLIGDKEVKVGFSGLGRQVLAQGLENEAEFDEFQTENTYSFEELGMSPDFFEVYGSDAINELIFLTEKAVRDEY